MPPIGLETTVPKNITSGKSLTFIRGMVIKYKIRYYIKTHIYLNLIYIFHIAIYHTDICVYVYIYISYILFNLGEGHTMISGVG